MGVRTPRDDASDLLTQVEDTIGGLDLASPSEVMALLQHMDKMAAYLDDFHRRGLDVRDLDLRWEAIHGSLRAKAGLVVRRVDLPAARQQRTPRPEAWWWYLDTYVAAQRQQAIRRGVVILLLILLVLGSLALVQRIFLPVDSATVARERHLAMAQQAAERGDQETALHEVEAALAVLPHDPELLIWHGVLLELLGRHDRGEDDFSRARQTMGDEVAFLITRSTVYGRVGAEQQSLVDAQRSVELAPTNARAVYTLAVALEANGRVGDAIRAYEDAARLANASNDPTLEVLAKTRLGMLLQRAPALLIPTPTAQ